MVKISSAYALAASALFFFNSFISCAYGHSLVFGPEFFSSQNSQSQQVVKRFSVRDASQKYIVSVQGGKGSENDVASGSIRINGKLVFSLEEMGKQAKMLTKPVTLKKQNSISVDVAGGAAAPVIVTIMILEQQKVTAKIPPVGKAVDLDGYAMVVFPAGTFEGNQVIIISVNASPAIQDIFEATDTGPRLPYEIRINTGDHAPKKDIEVSLKYPDSFFASEYQIHVFAHMYDNPDIPDVHDRFFLISSGLDDIVKMAMTTLPKHAFSNRHSKDGTYEAVITIGLVQ